jgi:outer membrane protein TolC
MRWIASLALIALALAACQGPLDDDSDDTFRQAVVAEHQRRLGAVAADKDTRLQREPSDVERELTDQRRQRLDEMSSPEAYADQPLELGQNLLAEESTETIQLSLDRAIRLAVRHNLDIEQARLAPAIAQAQWIQARAEFDAVLFTEANWEKRDTPRPAGNVPGLGGNEQTERTELVTGVRQPLTTGGEISVEGRLGREFQDPTVLTVDRYYTSGLTLNLRQPLLRGFGRDVNRAEIRLARNTLESERFALKRRLQQHVFEVEQAYWDLLLAKRRLQAQRRLLDRTIEDRDRLQQREGFDASPVRLTEAAAAVEQRRAELIRARTGLRQSSDRLKRLMNSPGLPVAGETLLLPAAEPTETPVDYNLLDAVTTALRERPALDQALLQIDDAGIRMRLTDNRVLPALDLNASIGASGLSEDSLGEALEKGTETDFIDYVLGASFEYPLGNRQAEARRARRLQRREAVLNYRDQAQQVVLEVKDALRQLNQAYQLIGAARASRRAAADALRAIEQREQAGAALTPEFLLDLKFQAQQRLAETQLEEAQALTSYNTAIARFHRALGTLLDRKGITVARAEK